VTSLFGARALRSFFVFDQCEMRVQFLSKVIIDASASKNIPEPPEW
jgi:hypothetical protein